MKGKIIKFKSNKKDKKILFLVLVIILFNLCTCYTLAKYSSELSGVASTKIAMPIVEIEGETQKEITIISPKASYSFAIKNYNENEEINEVEMVYNIEIISESLENLEIHLYKGNEEIELTNYKTGDIELLKGNKQIDEYRLDVTFLEQTEENIEAELQIKVESVQKSK